MIQLFIYELSKLDEFMFGQYCLKSMNDSIFFPNLASGKSSKPYTDALQKETNYMNRGQRPEAGVVFSTFVLFGSIRV